MNSFSLKDFDIFGNNLSLFYQGSRTIKTHIGGIVCLSTGLVLILLIIGFGQDFFKRINPSVIRESENPVNYPIFNMSKILYNSPVRLEDADGNELADYKSFYIQGVIYNYRFVNGSWNQTLFGYLNMTRCTVEMFKDPNIFKSSSLEKFWCPVWNGILLGGSWSSDFVGYYYFNINRCQENKTNANNETCHPLEKTLDLYNQSQIYFSGFFQKSLVTSSNYTMGVTTTLFNEYLQITFDLYKKVYYYFFETRMTTDYGWILSSRKVSSSLGFESKNFDFNKANDNGLVLGTVIYYFNKEIDKYTREYMKIQTLAANVGGILKIFLLAGSIVIGKYNDLFYYSDIIQNCSPEIIDKCFSSQQKEESIQDSLIKNNLNYSNNTNIRKASENSQLQRRSKTLSLFYNTEKISHPNKFGMSEIPVQSNISQAPQNKDIDNLSKNFPLNDQFGVKKAKSSKSFRGELEKNDDYCGLKSEEKFSNRSNTIINNKLQHNEEDFKEIKESSDNNKNYEDEITTQSFKEILSNFKKYSILALNTPKEQVKKSESFYSIASYFKSFISQRNNPINQKKVKLIELMKQNMNSKFDVEKMIFKDNFYKKFISILLSQEQINGINIEIMNERNTLLMRKSFYEID